MCGERYVHHAVVEQSTIIRLCSVTDARMTVSRIVCRILLLENSFLLKHYEHMNKNRNELGKFHHVYMELRCCMKRFFNSKMHLIKVKFLIVLVNKMPINASHNLRDLDKQT